MPNPARSREQSLLEQRLVLLAQAGDRAALDRLLQCVQRDLYHYLRRLTGRPSLAEDVLQEVLFTVFRKLRWLRDPELFRTWCYRIAGRAAWRTLQREGRQPSTGTAFTDMREAENPPPKESDELEHLPRLLGRLSPGSSAVMVLHYLERKTLAEIAALLDIPLGTVKSRLAYGLLRARQIFDRQEPS